jgi:hypothetical protein
MTMRIEGSCRCGAVRFACESHTPYPYQLCYCGICRKTAGGGGFAINLMADARSLEVDGKRMLRIWHAELCDDAGNCETSPAERHFCARCATALWLFDPRWPELVHPFASAVDSDLPMPPARVHMMLRHAASWVEPVIGSGDQSFQDYPEQSIEQWHRQRGLWIP